VKLKDGIAIADTSHDRHPDHRVHRPMQLGEDCNAKPLSGNVNCFTLVEPTIRQSYGRSISRAESSANNGCPIKAPDKLDAEHELKSWDRSEQLNDHLPIRSGA
jgi:hypothetical protein